MTKKPVIIFIVTSLVLSCAQFHVTREIRERDDLSKLKHSGVLFRIPHNSQISLKRFYGSLSRWIEPYKKINKLTIIDTASKNLSMSKGEYDRFLQFSADNDFQYYQALGIITNYLDKNKEELEKLREKYGLDSFIIYEVDTFLSPEMLLAHFRSMIVIVNTKNQVLYMDHQFDTYDIYEIDPQVLKENLLDQISNRFINLMLKLDYIEET
jgi:hypothetical protein